MKAENTAFLFTNHGGGRAHCPLYSRQPKPCFATPAYELPLVAVSRLLHIGFCCRAMPLPLLPQIFRFTKLVVKKGNPLGHGHPKRCEEAQWFLGNYNFGTILALQIM